MISGQVASVAGTAGSTTAWRGLVFQRHIVRSDSSHPSDIVVDLVLIMAEADSAGRLAPASLNDKLAWQPP
jgi:hypothetical protein